MSALPTNDFPVGYGSVPTDEELIEHFRLKIIGGQMNDLPVGYGFRPTDEELIGHLRLKINGGHAEVSCIREIDLCDRDPWKLPALSMIKSTDDVWFFFCPKRRKYRKGQRLDRATENGYWKPTGRDRVITSRMRAKIGMKKSLVFYRGRAPWGKKTDWVIHEYRATDELLDGTHLSQGEFVLCRLFQQAAPELENIDIFSPLQRMPDFPLHSQMQSAPGICSNLTGDINDTCLRGTSGVGAEAQSEWGNAWMWDTEWLW